MVKSVMKLKRKSLNCSQWEETEKIEDEPLKQKPTVAESYNDTGDSEADLPEQSATEDNESDQEGIASKKVKLVTPLLKKKTGIVYISSIPKHMNVTILRELLEPYGEVGRIYLQPERKDGTIKKKTAKGKRAMLRYTEGWVEFKRKRVAKLIVEQLNTKPISTRKKSVFCDILWSMKYLPRFKWIHLSERLSYERAVYKQKLRTEIAQARKEASFFQSHLDQSDAVRKKARKEKKANKEG
ncbi:activator of basal transcription 1-like [Armigeres subalbatus]|uniref:activator of basal transcription 1-like n=1 Tax=Armigeres subalbatus TaxID=124917 RepID=UPI002ED27F1E